MDVLQFNYPPPELWTSLVLHLFFSSHINRTPGAVMIQWDHGSLSWLAVAQFGHHRGGRRLPFFLLWLGNTQPVPLKLCHVIEMWVLGERWGHGPSRNEPKLGGIVEAGPWGWPWRLAPGGGRRADVARPALGREGVRASSWWDNAVVILSPQPLSNAFALKHSVCSSGSDLKVSGCQPCWRLWYVSRPEAVCFHHPVLVRELWSSWSCSGSLGGCPVPLP